MYCWSTWLSFWDYTCKRIYHLIKCLLITEWHYHCVPYFHLTDSVKCILPFIGCVYCEDVTINISFKVWPVLHTLRLRKKELLNQSTMVFKIIIHSKWQLSTFRTFFPSIKLVNMTIWETFSCQIINQKSPTVFCLGPESVSKVSKVKLKKNQYLRVSK